MCFDTDIQYCNKSESPKKAPPNTERGNSEDRIQTNEPILRQSVLRKAF
jgi:hypothetical protein